MGAMGFAGLSPEVISGRLYAGAGDGPLLAAAAVWDRLAGAWGSALRSYRAVVAELTDGPWRGAAAASMAEAAQQYMAWMQTVADGAEQTANRLRVAAAVYRQAFAAVVPPSVVAANRSELSSLVAGNVFGQNAGLIAANQAEYAQMSAQDVAAMYDYAAGSAAATTLPSFSAPPNATAGAAGQTQAAQAAQATAAAASPAQSTIGGLLQSNPLEQLLNNPLLQGIEQLGQRFSGFTDFAGAQGLGVAGVLLGGPDWGVQGAVVATQVYAAVMAGTPELASSVSGGTPGFTLAGAPVPAATAGSVLGSLLGSATSGGADVSAGLGRATPVSGLSVPPSWGASPAGRLAATALPATGPTNLATEAGLPLPGGFASGIPPVGGVVNAPRQGESSQQSAAGEKATPRSAGVPTASGPPAFAAATETGLTEREELNRVREAVAELRKTHEALKRSAAGMIREAKRR